MTEITFERHSGKQALANLEDMADLYIDARSESPDEHDEMFSRPSFIARTDKQARETGFELVTANSDAGLVGFSFGYTFRPGVWWGDATPPPREILDSGKLAVIELDVRKSYQRQGIGKRLIQELLAGRKEKYATLAATPDSPAHSMYLRLGWHKIGEFVTPPVMDAMIIPLSQSE